MLLSRNSLTLTREGDVFRITMTDTANDNTFSHAVLDDWTAALDLVSRSDGNAALIIGSNSPKTFSTGINLGWITTLPTAEIEPFLQRFDELFLRVATLNLPTIAEINGNCYAGGAILAAACDFRLMRADRGRFCYTEVKIRLPFTPAMLEVVRLLPNAQAMFELSVTADAWGGELCAARGIVDAAVSADDLPLLAQERAIQLAAKDRATYTAIKRGIRDRVNQLAVERGLSEPAQLGLQPGVNPFAR
ncbi:enoyl-CoA hydratase/carnithine racemase [Fluviicoccus keumensis]|uniref:Enoyl-CoA hydratase/carnithine racemase n=1 Tax=Fluviicoccus keumensis TaxID=1435465 RepID=A0A4Q7Z662_9GAMM|nr:enoyl-CoA hydratase/isomerase family protein [Fluviicoccus keumensis]RZU45223.1 enoyl-CoA hydratase/carnithine racemase [Fluviicoccus keumensis]